MNSKYEITNIPHEKYPFLHRIPVMSDQKTIGRTPPRQRANTKERRTTR